MDTKHEVNVMIVGLHGSGKTVLFSCLHDNYKRTINGYSLGANDLTMYKEMNDIYRGLKAGKWPATTSNSIPLTWELKKQDKNGKSVVRSLISGLDFPGEWLKNTFSRDEDILSEDCVQFLERLDKANVVVVLVNLKDSPRFSSDDDSQWAMKEMFDRLTDKNRPHGAPHLLIALSQADQYADIIEACGGVKEAFEKYFPELTQYGNFSVISVAAVNKTLLSYDEEKPLPDPDFSSDGLDEMMDWIIKKVDTWQNFFMGLLERVTGTLKKMGNEVAEQVIVVKDKLADQVGTVRSAIEDKVRKD